MRSKSHLSAIILVLGTFAFPPAGLASPNSTTQIPEPITGTSQTTVAVSLTPTVELINGSDHQHERVQEAVDSFVDLGLPLPDLGVRFSTDAGECHGHSGLFQPRFTPWRITICSDADFIYEHELAHAWELANLTDETRERFMRRRGLTVWNDSRVLWSERGVEAAAFIVQQGLLDQPVPTPLSDEMTSRVEAFRLLTGIPSPRLTR